MMLPDLQASFACEDVRVEATGAHTAVGIINFIGAPSVPIRLLKLCIWTRWSSGEGRYTQTTKIVCPDETTGLAEATTEFSLNHEESHATNVNFFAGLEFPEAGNYHVEIYLGDQLRLRYPVNVSLPIEAHPPNG